MQVADYASKVPNYSSQAAVKDFCGKPMRFRAFRNICYIQEAPAPNSVKFKFVQNKKEIARISDTRIAHAEPAHELSNLASNGERAQMEFDAQQIDSSTLTIQIDAPDGQRATVHLDLASIR